jgi:dienelactone hydrolase
VWVKFSRAGRLVKCCERDNGDRWPGKPDKAASRTRNCDILHFLGVCLARQQLGRDWRDHRRAGDDLGQAAPTYSREGRALIYNALSDVGVYFQWHEFNAAHAFLRDEDPRYDPAVARICYGMVLELFTRTLNKE